MKKLFIICSIIVLYSCGGNSEKSTDSKQDEVSTPEINADQSAEDIELQKWLAGKSWTPVESAAPMAALNLQANGNYELAAGYPDKWYISKGELVLKGLTEWPIEKVDDNSFKLGVKATETFYEYKFNKNL